MTIKEVEELSNMTRANIRFYEKEGLITPQRDSNGYRNYTEQDVDILKRIRLLRTVHLGLEEIRSLSEKESELTDVLLIHLRTLKKEQKDLEQSKAICEQMCKDRAAYESFDAEHYFNFLNKAPSEIPAELEADSLPKVTAPWKRYFARLIDEAIYLESDSGAWFSYEYQTNRMGICSHRDHNAVCFASYGRACHAFKIWYDTREISVWFSSVGRKRCTAYMERGL